MHTAAQRKAMPGKTVLVVDDNPTVRAQLSELFLSDGFTVCVQAENGLRAIDVAAESKPDVIILDLAMPVMNGMDAAPKLKELLPHTPIILFSLHSAYLKQQELNSFGISDIFTKGDSLDQLVAKVHKLIEKDEP
jgi:CheY-like chemotaxis protein